MSQQQSFASFGAAATTGTGTSFVANDTATAPSVDGGTATAVSSLTSTPATTNASNISGTPGVATTVAMPNAALSVPTAVTPTTSISVPVSANNTVTATLNFRQFESAMEKLSVEVHEQEKDFIAQATNSNYYDQLILSNAQKMSQMAQGLEGIKQEQLHLESMLKSAKDSQSEMESMIQQLEDSLPTPEQWSSQYNVNQQWDQDRGKVLNAALDLDNDMQQLTSELMELINHANLKNKMKSADPVSRVVSVMNEHTETLQWIDEATETLKSKLEDLSKVQKDCRRQQERALRLMFATEK